MLTISEKKELNYEKLSPDLKLKIDAAFESPDLIVAIALSAQLRAWANEMILKPFTIRGEETIEVTDDGVKAALKEAVTSRQNTETALKVVKELEEVAERLKVVQARLSPQDKNLSNKEIVTHNDLKGVAFGGQGK
jgi:biotin synthase-related radical SAM superfamily protein